MIRDPNAAAIIIAHHYYQQKKSEDSGTKSKFSAQFRDRFKQSDDWNDYALRWFNIANQSRNSAFEKLNQFIQNILVVNRRTRIRMKTSRANSWSCSRWASTTATTRTTSKRPPRRSPDT